ncbi:MAG TPA: cation:proton antiporter [Pirellulales bacterium]
MNFLIVFACLLLLAVLLSALAERSVLSAAVLFLLGGVLSGKDLLGFIRLHPDEPAVSLLAELALVSVLFTEGLHVRAGDLLRAWRLPGRALLFGMPLTLLGIALLARWLLGMEWPTALLIAAVLSPTDPVFAAAIMGRQEIPFGVRHLLNIESGINDGLALPAVMLLLDWTSHVDTSAATMAAKLLGGIAIGAGIAGAAALLERSRLFAAAGLHRPLFSFAVGLLVLALNWITGANAYLGAFTAGMTLGNLHPQISHDFDDLGGQVAELLKLAAILAFGALLSPRMLAETPPAGYLFVLLVLVLVRPVALGLALAGSGLDWRERLVAAWFGPKGFASVVYGILVLKSSVPDAQYAFDLIALTIAGSMIAHSSTDVLVARWFARSPDAA